MHIDDDDIAALGYACPEWTTCVSACSSDVTAVRDSRKSTQPLLRYAS